MYTTFTCNVNQSQGLKDAYKKPTLKNYEYYQGPPWRTLDRQY